MAKCTTRYDAETHEGLLTTEVDLYDQAPHNYSQLEINHAMQALCSPPFLGNITKMREAADGQPVKNDRGEIVQPRYETEDLIRFMAILAAIQSSSR